MAKVSTPPSNVRLVRQHLPHALAYSVVLAVAVLISYELSTAILDHISLVPKRDDKLGGMWSVVATVFVYRYSASQRKTAALSRLVATLVSFILCLVYLLFLPFSPWGLAVVIGVGALVLALLGHASDIVTASIASTIVMVDASLSTDDAWLLPILRLSDTTVGIAVGAAFASIAVRFGHWEAEVHGHPVRTTDSPSIDAAVAPHRIDSGQAHEDGIALAGPQRAGAAQDSGSPSTKR